MSYCKISKTSFIWIEHLCSNYKCSSCICWVFWIYSKWNLINHVRCPSWIIIVPRLVVILFNSPWISHEEHIVSDIFKICHLKCSKHRICVTVRKTTYILILVCCTRGWCCLRSDYVSKLSSI
jgi:hypothetical protein